MSREPVGAGGDIGEDTGAIQVLYRCLVSAPVLPLVHKLRKPLVCSMSIRHSSISNLDRLGGSWYNTLKLSIQVWSIEL